MAYLCSTSDVFDLLPGFNQTETAGLISAALERADAYLRHIFAVKYIFEDGNVPSVVSACCSYEAAYLAICMSYTGGGEDKIPALADLYKQKAAELRDSILDGTLLGEDGLSYPITGTAAGAYCPRFVKVD